MLIHSFLLKVYQSSLVMDITSALPTYVITLREGVEAALVVGIVLACLQKAKAAHLYQWVYAGIGVGVAASALVGLLLGWGIQVLSASYPQYTPVIEPLLEAIFGVIAIVMLSWMLIWMTQQAKVMKSEIEGAVQSALTTDKNAGWGIFTLIFIAVLREGFEAVSLILAYFQQGIFPAVGAVLGLVSAVIIGVLLFKWGVKINIRQFFQIMGVFLLLIVSGLTLSALAHFDVALKSLSQLSSESESLCFYYEHLAKNPACILGPLVLNTSKILPDRQFPGIVLKALFGYREKLYLVQVVTYLTFLLTVGGLYFGSLNRPSDSAVQSSKVAQS